MPGREIIFISDDHYVDHLPRPESDTTYARCNGQLFPTQHELAQRSFIDEATGTEFTIYANETYLVQFAQPSTYNGKQVVRIQGSFNLRHSEDLFLIHPRIFFVNGSSIELKEKALLLRPEDQPIIIDSQSQCVYNGVPTE